MSKRAILAGGSESAGCMRRRWDDTSEAPMRVALWHAHCEDDEVVRMRGLSMRSDAAADSQAHRWERACMIMPAGLVQGPEGAPEEASLCMVPRGERF